VKPSDATYEGTITHLDMSDDTASPPLAEQGQMGLNFTSLLTKVNIYYDYV